MVQMTQTLPSRSSEVPVDPPPPPAGVDSWGFFDRLLSQAHVVGTPGSGFGAAGEGYFRLSAFNSRDNVNEAMERIKAALG